MHHRLVTLALAVAISVAGSFAALQADQEWFKHSHDERESIQLGPRPFFLVNDMQESRLKRELLSCADGPFNVRTARSRTPTFRSGTAARHCSSPSIRSRPTRPAPAWALASSNAM
jgi:hypothetical protein